MPLFLGWIGAAHAFCGTYVGSPGVELVNRTSQVVIARQGTKTTLTLVADYEGELSDFALLIPVPESLEADRVRTIDPSIVDRLDRYSTPRLVSYTCRDAVDVQPLGCSLVLGGCGGSEAYDSLGTIPIDVDVDTSAGAVTVEAAFQLAEYDVVMLAAEGADGLYGWLDDNGFAVPPGGEDVLQGYIDAGSHFLAAKVHLDAVSEEGPARLSPIQLRYEAEDWTLPILIGTISGSGEQEVIVYALTDNAEGDVAIANYPEHEVEDECMWPADEWPTFADFYKDALVGARGSDGPGWVTEYNWTLYQLSQSSYHCDPCTVERDELYDAGELQDLGFTDPIPTGSTTWGYTSTSTGVQPGNGALLTRLRLVYDPAEIHEDLALYTTGFHDVNRQIRFVEYDRRLEFLFPVCGQGYVDDPGMCGDELDDASKGKGAASTPAGLAFVIGGLALTILRRRWA